VETIAPNERSCALNDVCWTVSVHECNVDAHSLRRALVSNVIGSAIQEFFGMFTNAVAHAPWALIGSLGLFVAGAILVRNKIAAWVWLSGLALGVCYTVWRLRLR